MSIKHNSFRKSTYCLLSVAIVLLICFTQINLCDNNSSNSTKIKPIQQKSNKLTFRIPNSDLNESQQTSDTDVDSRLERKRRLANDEKG